jgi:hypothetical protein
MHHQLREDQIQKADTAGYMRALDHVARGLLDQSNHGQPGPGEALGDRPDNVIPLNADVPIWADDGHEQKAQ